MHPDTRLIIVRTLVAADNSIPPGSKLTDSTAALYGGGFLPVGTNDRCISRLLCALGHRKCPIRTISYS